MEKTFLTIVELAGETGESVAVWRKRILRREISYTKFGRNVRVSRDTLARFISERTVLARDGGGHQTEAAR